MIVIGQLVCTRGQIVWCCGHWVWVLEQAVKVPFEQMVCKALHCVAASTAHWVAVPKSVGQTVYCRGH